MIKTLNYENLIDDLVEKNVKRFYLRTDNFFTSFKGILTFNYKFDFL